MRPERRNQANAYRTRSSRRDRRSPAANRSGRPFRSRFTAVGIKKRLGEQPKPPTPTLPHAVEPVGNTPVSQSTTKARPTRIDFSEEEYPPDKPPAKRTSSRSTRQNARLSRASLAVIDSPNMAIANFLHIVTHAAPKTALVTTKRTGRRPTPWDHRQATAACAK